MNVWMPHAIARNLDRSTAEEMDFSGIGLKHCDELQAGTKDGHLEELMPIIQPKAAVNEEAATAQQAMYNQPGSIAKNQAREVDIVALAEFVHDLDKMEALLIEFRRMNEDVSINTKDGCGLLSVPDDFRKQYAMVLEQIRDVNDKVASSVLYLREHNTYPGCLMPQWQKPVQKINDARVNQACFNASSVLSQDSGINAMEIIESSKQKAKIIVEAALQAAPLKEGEDAFIKIGEALGLISDTISSSRPAPLDPVNEENSTKQGSIPNEMQFSSDLIANCVSTLFVIQKCAERKQYQPAEVVQVLESALANLHPLSVQNMPVYREIETCIDIIKNQLLTLVPTIDDAEKTLLLK